MASVISFTELTVIPPNLEMENLINFSLGQVSLSVPESHKRSKSDPAQQAIAIDDASEATIAEPFQEPHLMRTCRQRLR